MKTSSMVVACLALTLVSLQAQVAAAPAGADPSGYTVAGRDGNSCVWGRVVYETNSAGRVVPQKHSYVELQAGMNHLVNGQWIPSKEQIDILPDGSAAATNGQHQAYFPGDIFQGAIGLVTAEGLELQSRPLLLCYVDGTKSVILAELKSSAGELVGSNQVIYPDAFLGVKADLRYSNTKGGLEQDVILRQRLAAPPKRLVSIRGRLGWNC